MIIETRHIAKAQLRNYAPPPAYKKRAILLSSLTLSHEGWTVLWIGSFSEELQTSCLSSLRVSGR